MSSAFKRKKLKISPTLGTPGRMALEPQASRPQTTCKSCVNLSLSPRLLPATQNGQDAQHSLNAGIMDWGVLSGSFSMSPETNNQNLRFQTSDSRVTEIEIKGKARFQQLTATRTETQTVDRVLIEAWSWKWNGNSISGSKSHHSEQGCMNKILLPWWRCLRGRTITLDHDLTGFSHSGWLLWFEVCDEEEASQWGRQESCFSHRRRGTGRPTESRIKYTLRKQTPIDLLPAAGWYLPIAIQLKVISQDLSRGWS